MSHLLQCSVYRYAVYTGMHMFAKTRKRQLVDMLHKNGLSISYTRVLEISSQLGEAVVAQYVEDGVVCPLVLRKKFQLQWSTTLTTIQRTSISIFQHPTSEQLGEEREPIKLNAAVKVKKVPELPNAFTNV